MSDVEVVTNYFGTFGLESRDAIDSFLGTNGDNRAERVVQINRIGGYLVDSVGLYPREIQDWFTQGMSRLDGARPVDVLHEKDGFAMVYDEAVRWYDDTRELV